MLVFPCNRYQKRAWWSRSHLCVGNRQWWTLWWPLQLWWLYHQHFHSVHRCCQRSWKVSLVCWTLSINSCRYLQQWGNTRQTRQADCYNWFTSLLHKKPYWDFSRCSISCRFVTVWLYPVLIQVCLSLSEFKTLFTCICKQGGILWWCILWRNNIV